MGARELEALLQTTLNDRRLSASTRASIERVFAAREMSPEAVTLFCAQAIVLARASLADARLRDTFAWVLRLAHLVDEPAPRAAPPEPPPKPAKAAAPAGAPASAAYFSPGDDCLHAIQGEFRRARKRVDVCVFTITDDRIREALLDAKRRGVAVRVISDNDKSLDEGSDIEPLRRAGVDVRIDKTEAHMHHKFALFDGERLLTGSYNWTRSAANYNEENLVITADAALVASFAREFDRLWRLFA